MTTVLIRAASNVESLVLHRCADLARIRAVHVILGALVRAGRATPTANSFGGFSGLEALSDWSKLGGMTVNEKALDFGCPVCNAKPREECVRIDGHTMCEPHRTRKNLILGIKPRNRREDINRIAERVVRVV